MQETVELDGSGASFLMDRWERGAADSNAGYGMTCVLEGGALLEKVRRPQFSPKLYNTNFAINEFWTPVNVALRRLMRVSSLLNDFPDGSRRLGVRNTFLSHPQATAQL